MTDAFNETALAMRGHQLAMMIHASAELGIADKVGDGIGYIELAEAAGARADLLVRMLRAMASFGIFAVDAQGRVTHTEKSRFLRSDNVPTLHYAARFWGMESIWGTWGKVPDMLKSGRPAFELVYGMPNFDYLAQQPEQSAIFDAFMQHSPDDRHAAVAEAYDFAGKRVVDVGGGNGGLIAAILRRYADASGVVADQAAVVAAVPEIMGPLMARCEAAPSNFFESLPAGGDVYTMSQILHDWSDEKCLVILGCIRRAIPDHGRLVIIERVLADDASSEPPMNRLADMQMMVLFPGARERTLPEFGVLLQKTGFRVQRHLPTRSAYGLVEASPA